MEIPAGFFNVSFNKAMAFGYRTDDVDEFVTKALRIVKELQEENDALQQKLEVLASNLENYREEEDSLRSALIGAQKLGDSILKDSRQKAEKTINDAAERARQITLDAATRVDKQQYELEQIQAETVKFKEKLFSTYKTHLDIIKNIPSDYDDNRRKPRPQTPAQPAASVPEQPEEEPEESYRSAELREGDGYDERSSAIYTGDCAGEPEDTQGDEQEDYFRSPFIVDEPDSDKPFVEQPPYTEEPAYEDDYDESCEAPHDVGAEPPTAAANQPTPPEDDDISARSAAPRKIDVQDLFDPHPRTQVDIGGIKGEAVDFSYDMTKEYYRELKQTKNQSKNQAKAKAQVQTPYVDDDDDDDDDDFAAQLAANKKKLISELSPTRIPYIDDDDDDDDFAVPLTSKKKQVVSQKFGVLKFGDAFDLRED